ncbi:Molybdopterin synthase catalytic subunit [Phytophthora cinnamomi]|uniref:Molybdopterin synthase catalytic subunit n=1 Tax=Phytophthora cinnamomi TaxID=4785 RepID=UPI003559A0CF|nr:Molybdopterin synthase catalytic subunit [Phytophthora cinnamomi]
MGLLPPRKKTTLLFKTRLSAHKRPDEDPLVTTLLPLEAQQLKTRILEAHPESYLRFSVTRMRHIVAQLPVEIPAELRGKNLIATRVAGHNVPFTRGMWDRKMTLYRKRMLDIIGEGVHYH